jgi:ferredoxin
VAYEVWIDTDECVSAAKCAASAPEFFTLDDDGLGAVIPGATAPDDAVLLRIARNCPSGAIRLRRDGVDVDV